MTQFALFVRLTATEAGKPKALPFDGWRFEGIVDDHKAVVAFEAAVARDIRSSRRGDAMKTEGFRVIPLEA